MTITLGYAAQLSRHAIGNRKTALSQAWIANQAGRELFSAHAWAFRRRPSTTLDVTANQDFIVLPLDCAHVVSVKGFASDFSVGATSGTLLDEHRAGTRPQQYSLVYCVAHDADHRPVLDIYPEYPTNLPKALRLRYRAGWVSAKDDDSELKMPEWLEPLYVEWLMEYTRALHHEDAGNWNQRKSDLLRRETFRTAKLEDGSVQEEYGQIAGGAASIDRGHSAEPSLEPLEFP